MENFNQCAGGSCSAGRKNSSGCGCCCNKNKESCCNRDCSCGKTCGCCKGSGSGSCSCCDFSKKLFDLADQAWMEVLKEKIKEQIKSSNNGQLDQLAKLITEANKNRWKDKMNAKKECNNYRDQIQRFFEGY